MKLPLYANVANQLPEHIRESYPQFVLFLEAYYEWMHNQNNLTGAAKGIIDLRDVDKTLDQFVDDIIKELSSESLATVATDKRLFVKHLHDLFSSKGSEKSFKLFFRLLYDMDIEVSYPSENILRASDGQWFNQKTITLTLVSGDVRNLPGTIVTGQTSGAIAYIETVESFYADGVLKHLATINNRNLTGTFTVNEIVKSRIGDPEESSYIINQDIVNISITNPGVRYSEGDVVNITSLTGSGAKAYITRVSAPSKIKINATYNKIGNIVTIDLQNEYHKLSVGDWVFLDFSAGIQTGNYQVSNLPSEFVFQITHNPPENISQEFVDVYNAKESGKIYQIELLERGSGYEDANYTITSAGGSGAILSINFGTVSDYIGKWKNNRGIISNSATVLQDNFKYQQFSYVIKSAESIVLWRDLFKRMVHPAGTVFFSDTVIPVNGSVKAARKDEYYRIVSSVKVNSGNVTVNYNYSISSKVNKSGVGYNNLASLNKTKSNIPPIKVNDQFTIDTQDSTYGGYSNYNYVGTPNFGYWGTIDSSSDDLTYGSAAFGSYVFSGYMVDINFKNRNFRIEEFYSASDLSNEISIADRSIMIPDSTIKIYMNVVGGVEGEGSMLFFFPW